MRKTSIVELISKDKCYGCGCCSAVCPKAAISMKIDDEGFLHPKLNVEQCNNCGLCTGICPGIEHKINNNILDSYPFALWAEEPKIRIAASSGGVALLMALSFNNEGYAVLGAIFDKGFRLVKHIVADSPVDIIKTIGSKYVQSDASLAFRTAFLDEHKNYLAFGTPCQISGLRRLIEHKRNKHNYFLIDFFCHGVPSYLLWLAFIDALVKKIGELQYLELRNKIRGWHKFGIFAVGEKGIYIGDFMQSFFGRFYLSDYCLRPTCYSCQYRQSSDADLRIGDFWGREFSNDLLGTSLAIPLNEKGLELIERTPGLIFRSVPKSWTLDSQPMSKQISVSMPSDYALVMKKLRDRKALDKVYREHLAWKYRKQKAIELSYGLARAILPPIAIKALRVAKRFIGGQQ